MPLPDDPNLEQLRKQAKDLRDLARAGIPGALDEAAAQGDIEMARLLLDLGADLTIKDGRFDSTPLGWARHFGRPAMVELLEPLSS